MNSPFLRNGVCIIPGRSVMHVGWSTIRKIQAEQHPYCALCGFRPPHGNNDVHHIIPRHIRADLALELWNLVTLCRRYDCHLRAGHFGNYRKYWNPDILKVIGNTGRSLMLAEESFKENQQKIEQALGMDDKMKAKRSHGNFMTD